MQTWDKRETRTGRFRKSHPCDCCGQPVGAKYLTDGEVCGNTDGPGFYLCSRKSCGKLPGGVWVRNLPIAERRLHYRMVRANFDQPRLI